MLLLYRNYGLWNAGYYEFTFHYASTLSPHRMYLLTRLFLFTFHYASTLSLHSASFSATLRYLHSTMLLLYRMLLGWWRVGVINLHSTMLLLYRSWAVSESSYAPWFTFHYASTLSYVVQSGDCLYNIFTFHYASTLSCASAAGSVFTVIFTFHYASTLSDVVRENNQTYRHLHSTMLLLYRSRSNTETLRKKNLHSTMLLLYRMHPLTDLLQCFRIYIPLCFYFIIVE